jgi:iron complex transport system substrate-binding protein
MALFIIGIATARAPSAAAFPLTVTDDLGRKVTVSAVPARIVSLAPSNTEILFAIGAGAQVVGVTTLCNFPPEAQTRAIVGGLLARTISVEAIVALRPDLVFAAGALHRTVVEALERVGIPVVALAPRRFEEVYANVAMAGRLTGHASEAARVATTMRARAAAVAATTRDLEPDRRPTVFYEVWHEPLMTAGPGTFIGQMIALAGGRNIFADVREDYPQISAETVIRRDPAVILGPDHHAQHLTAQKIRARPGWAGIKAVRAGRIYLVNGDIVSRPGPRLVEALEIIARRLHPDLFR